MNRTLIFDRENGDWLLFVIKKVPALFSRVDARPTGKQRDALEFCLFLALYTLDTRSCSPIHYPLTLYANSVGQPL